MIFYLILGFSALVLLGAAVACYKIRKAGQEINSRNTDRTALLEGGLLQWKRWTVQLLASSVLHPSVQ